MLMSLKNLKIQYSLQEKFNMNIRECKFIVQTVFLIVNFIEPVLVNFD